ncbi:MAG: laccase domain-containing protein [Eubacterium sp.]
MLRSILRIPVHRAIGMSHSGWRGTVGRMGRATLLKMKEQYGTDPENVICAISASIRMDCYEVSEDVADAFKQEFPDGRRKFSLIRKMGNINWICGKQTRLF